MRAAVRGVSRRPEAVEVLQLKERKKVRKSE